MRNIEQFLELPRIEPNKLSAGERSQEFVEIYSEFDLDAAKAQAERCLDCASPYCQWACPVSNYIPNWLKLVAEGDVMGAVEMSHKTNPLPEMCGRICPQDRLCEGACTLEDTGFKAVTIGAVERFILEEAVKMGWQPNIEHIDKVGKRVAVIGAGPAGLACADELIKHGVDVEIFEKQNEAGGLLMFGIPEFKLEKNIVIRRRQMLEQMGVVFHFNCEIGNDFEFSEIEQQFDCVFVGLGTYKYMHGNLNIDGVKGSQMALPFLIDNINFRQGYGIYADQSVSAPRLNVTNKRVIVLGGGDTAMDCNRTAIRQSAKSVTCVYRRDRENMPGSPKEVTNAIEEGVHFEFSQSPVGLVTNDDKQVIGVEVMQTELTDADELGRRRPVEVVGSNRVIDCDVVIIAFGFSANPPEWLQVNLKNNQTVDCQAQQAFPFQTSRDHIFAGGDMVMGSSLVVQAVNEGKQAAQGILDYLEV